MVLCIIVGCGTKTSNNDSIGLFRIPAVIHNQGEAYKKLTQDRRNAWISAVSRDDTGTKAILNTERVCGKTLRLLRRKPKESSFESKSASKNAKHNEFESKHCSNNKSVRHDKNGKNYSNGENASQQQNG